MPLTKKGKKIKRAMMETYGKEKGERVFYASERVGKIHGVKIGGMSEHNVVTTESPGDVYEVDVDNYGLEWDPASQGD